MELTLKALQDAVSGTACAFRCRCRLQPAGGPGDKVFPPTYAGAVYAKEQRRVPGRNDAVECVLLDSVQSQANRMEEALQAAVDQERLTIPVIEVDFTAEDLPVPLGKVTSLEAPHRIADAILRDSLLVDVPFRQTEEGQSLDTASMANATPLYKLCPTALIFGMWDSTGPKGGMGVKFQRAIVSEIVGIDAVFGVKTSSRIDPLQIRSAVRVTKGSNGGWVVSADPQARGTLAPSEINHGNIPPDISLGGVTIAAAEQVATLSLPALRRLKFSVAGAEMDRQAEINLAGRTTLAALALCAAALAAERGFDLRSRCLLWPTETMEWELLDRPGQTPERLALTADTAIAVLNEAVAEAEKLGLHWRTEPLVLTPAPQLVELVTKSQELAATAAASEGD